MKVNGHRPGSPEIPDSVSKHVSLWRHTSIKVGGPARFFASPRNAEEVCRLLDWADQHDMPTAVLGGGTNTIFPDSGFHGLVLELTRLRGIRGAEEGLTVASGEPLSLVVDRACDLGYGGMEWAAGIPGTIGGAAAMNAGTRDGDMASVVTEICLALPGGSRWVDAGDLDYGYRTSAVKEGRLDGVIVDVRLRLCPADGLACAQRVAQIRRARASRLPSGATFGSIFRNPPSGLTAGQLLDRAGCKAMRVGAVRVSSQHANILVNEGKANAFEVLELIRRMRDRVRERFGIDLREEVVAIGFECGRDDA